MVIITIALVYILGLTLFVSILQRRKNRGVTGESFLYADRSLGKWVGGATVALSAIGAVHTIGLMEAGSINGFVSLWLCMGGAISCALEGAFFAPFFRKLKVSTVPESYERMFDRRTRLMASVIGIVMMFTILSMEVQGGGILFNQLTGINMTASIIVFMVCAVLYMILSGMWQVAWLNMTNVIVMYAVVIVSFLFITKNLPNGWAGVQAFYADSGQAARLNIWPQGWQAWLAAPIPLFIGTFMQNPLDQGKMSYYIAAKNTRTSRNMGFIAALFNGPFGVFTVVFGIAAMAVPAYAALGTKTAGINLLLGSVPTFLAGLVLATFLAIVLSTFARMSMGLSQVIVADFYLPFSKNPRKHEIVPKLSRILIILSGLLAIIPAFKMPVILLGIMYVFAIMAPIFVCFILGVFWKRNHIASFYSMLIGLIVTTVWEYSPLKAALGAPDWLASMYIALLSTLIVYIVLTNILSGTKPGMSRTLRESKEEFLINRV